MILTEIYRYLERRRQATLAELSQTFNTDPKVMHDMLELWIRKGRIRRKPLTAACGSRCMRCTPEQVEVYIYNVNSTK